MWIEQAMNEMVDKGSYIDEDDALECGMPHDQRASERVTSNCSVYEKNETFLEVCDQFENLRGMPGFAVAFIPACMILFAMYMCSCFIGDWIRGASSDGQPYGWDEIIVGILTILTTIFIVWLAKKLAFPIVRKDYFTSRRILIRFNRVTRKVYVHNPPFAGGIRIYDWDATQAVLDNSGEEATLPANQEDARKGDGRLVMGWVDPESRRMLGMLFVGRAAGNGLKGLAWWEYIRRYMEEGADSVPKPFPRLWKSIWPQTSLLNMFYLYPERLIHGGLWWWFLLAPLAPFDFLRALLHWIAMVLCVEPKFPPEIENAGRTTGRADTP